MDVLDVVYVKQLNVLRLLLSREVFPYSYLTVEEDDNSAQKGPRG